MPVLYSKKIDTVNAIQLCEYRETRLALIIAVSGTDDVTISTNFFDVTGSTITGITIPKNTCFTLTHILHGEIIWYQWWAECSNSYITVWEWFCTPNIPGGIVTPTKTLCETTKVIEGGCCKPNKKKCTTKQNAQKAQLQKLVEDAKKAQWPVNRMFPQQKDR